MASLTEAWSVNLNDKVILRKLLRSRELVLLNVSLKVEKLAKSAIWFFRHY